MAELLGFQKVVAQLQKRAARARQDNKVSVVVGYTAAYALYVHEDRQAYHEVGKAGFLLDPARRLANDVARIVRDALTRGLTTAQALLLGGLFLQRESQREVPVDTGNLRGSAFTRLE